DRGLARGRHRDRARLRIAGRRRRRLPRLQLPAGARHPRRRRLDPARLSCRRARHHRLAQRRLAPVVSAARLRAVHRRCDAHPHPAAAAARAGLAGAQGALLPAPGADGLRPPRHRRRRLRRDAGLRRRSAARARPGARGAGRSLRRRDHRARRARGVGGPALGASPAGEWRRDMNIRRYIVFGHDVVAASVAWLAAFWLRFNLDIPDEYREVMLDRLLFVVGVHAVIFWLLGLYRGLWRYASLPDLQRILVAVGLAALGVPALLAILRLRTPVPRSVFLIAPILLAVAMGGSRFAYRAWREGRLTTLIVHPQAVPVLVLGANAAAAALVKELAGSAQLRVVGVLDDESSKHGASVAGAKVLGPIAAIAAVAQRFGSRQAIIAMPEATHGERKRAVDLCTQAGLEVMTVPALSDIVSGRVSVSALRPIELDDLLGRDPVQLDEAGLQGFFGGKTVLVTGAGGSIGAELCRQIARFQPTRLVLFEQSEFSLYTIEQEFRDRRSPVEIVAAIGDAKSEARVAEVFGRYRPDIVFHAAAYKHVPLMEDDNALEAVRNNVLSTLAIARA